MKNKSKLLVASVVVSVFSIEAALASTMRCGTHLIAGGDRDSPGKYEVLRRCGEPTDRYGNTWVYKKSGAAHVLYFTRQGQLERIETE